MFKKKTVKTSLIFLMMFFSFKLGAESTKIENLYKYQLKNGLELYVAENHTVPLVYVEIAVRGGGIAQTAENAGLFHLYEHMMFKGNNKFKTAEEMQNELTKLGVTSWNGTTDTEYVNYFFTVPKQKLQEGLEFWNNAIRFPKINEREFEAEKKVVLSEIEGKKNDKSQILYDFISRKFFPEAPWVRSPGGTSEVVKNATVAQLKQIQKEYYIPNNSALFVGGDVNPDDVYKLVKKIYGNWKKGPDPWKNNKKQFDSNPLKQTEFYVMPFDKMSPMLAQVHVMFRGPDVEFNRDETYAMDMLLLAAENPQGYYKVSLAGNEDFAIPDVDYCYLSYKSSRRLGVITAGAVMQAPEQFLAERTKLFEKEVRSSVENFFSEEDEEIERKMNLVQKQLHNQNVYEKETAPGLLSTTRFWWGCADSDYYFNYADSINKVTKDEISSLIEKYMLEKNALVIVLVNPEVYEQTYENFEKNGFIEIK